MKIKKSTKRIILVGVVALVAYLIVNRTIQSRIAQHAAGNLNGIWVPKVY
jgi:hypothetical protein